MSEELVYTEEDMSEAVFAARSEGYQEGYSEGEEVGYDNGRDSGLEEGYEKGKEEAYDAAFDDGYLDGEEWGRGEGYQEGMAESPQLLGRELALKSGAMFEVVVSYLLSEEGRKLLLEDEYV